MNQPAIVLITCDELRADVLSCYGGKVIQTPHIDSIAAKGTRFDKFYTVSPWCLPARCSILTGQYPHQTGAYSNFRQSPLNKDIPNLFTVLGDAGYHTSMFGKCHFAPVPYSETRAEKTLPYDEFRDYYTSLGMNHLELQDGKQTSIWFCDDYSKQLDQAQHLKAYRDTNWNRENRLVYPFPAPASWHPDCWVGERGAEYIKSWDREEPLFAWISFSGPHYPFDSPQEYLDKIDPAKLPPRVTRENEWDDPHRIHYNSYHGGGNIDGARCAPEGATKNYTEEHWDTLRTSYYANMALIDDKVGEILAAVREKYGDNALVMFTVDHGEMLGDHSLWGKHNCAYDQVFNIPFLLQLPGGKVTEPSGLIVNSNDILPTAAEAAGAKAQAVWNGASLYTRLQAQQGMDYTFAEGEGFVAVTDGRYKYVHIQKPDESFRELLDTKVDPQEFTNYINDPAYATVLARLREQIIEHFIPAVLP